MNTTFQTTLQSILTSTLPTIQQLEYQQREINRLTTKYVENMKHFITLKTTLLNSLFQCEIEETQFNQNNNKTK